MKLGLLLPLCAAAKTAESQHWAVLVAGSFGFSNYRHQADVCHAYQVVKSHGIPEENIIVMAYDDIAYADGMNKNPFPGQIFNKPTAAGVPGKDVYAGCKIDYKGDDVNPDNFVKVLTGTASGKRLQSTSDDNVFVFFADHGAVGLIGFPNYVDFHKDDFQQIFKTMHSKNMYKKLTVYLETCESGSMFEGMTTPGVYAVSATGTDTPSEAVYCNEDATVNGVWIRDATCLGDLFSVSWLEDADATDITKETLDEQFSLVDTKCYDKQSPMQWGDKSFKTDKVSEYLSGPSSSVGDGRATAKVSAEPSRSSVSVREVDLMQAYLKYASAKTSEERLAAGMQLQSVLKDQLAVEAAYEKFLRIVYPGNEVKQAAARTSNSPADHRDCELAARESFKQHGAFDSYTGFALQFHKYVVNVCADVAATGSNTDVAQAAKQACESSVVV